MFVRHSMDTAAVLILALAAALLLSSWLLLRMLRWLRSCWAKSRTPAAKKAVY